MFRLFVLLSAVVTSFSTFAETKIFPTQDIDSFADSVSISGNRILVGAKRAGSMNGSGAAYIFENGAQGWTQTQILTPQDADFNDEFGAAVSLLGNRAAISTFKDDGEIGSVYIFEYNGNTWVETHKIKASDGQSGDQFGFSISLAENKILVGAPQNDRSSANILDADKGAAYIFDFNSNTNSWQQTIKLTPNNDVGARFGSSVSLSANRAVVSAPNDGLMSGQSGGSAFVFDLQNNVWQESQKLVAVSGSASLFGHSLDHSGDKIIIGDYVGRSVRFFEKQAQGWVETQVISKTGDSFFGHSVKILDNKALVGDPSHNNSAGQVTLLEKAGNNWIESQTYSASDGLAADSYGWAVDFDAMNIVVGTPNGNINDPSRPDAAYIYNLGALDDLIFADGFEQSQ